LTASYIGKAWIALLILVGMALGIAALVLVVKMSL
jgi:hypothetical protein